MKNYFCLFSLVLLVFSCGDPEEILFEGPNHVRFTEESGSVVENFADPSNQNLTPPITVRIHMAGPQLNSETIVNFDAFGDAREGVDFRIVGPPNAEKRVVIPARESFGSFQFVPINNRLRDGDRSIVFAITGVNNGLQIGRGAGNQIGRTMRYEIRDDDCLLDLRLFQGTWQVEERIGNDDPVQYTVNIAPDFDFNNRIVISNLGNLNNTSVFLNVDLCLRQCFIPEQRVTNLNAQRPNVRTLNPGNFDLEGGRISFTYTMDRLGNTTRQFVATRNR